MRGLLSTILFLGAASAAHAAGHESSLSCVDGASGFNLSIISFDVGATAPVAPSGSGGSGSKVVFKPLDVHTHLTNFDAAFKSLLTGHAYPSCTLTTLAAYGETTTFLFKNVIIDGVDMIVDSTHGEAARNAYTDITFVYQAVQFTQVPGGNTPN